MVLLGLKRQPDEDILESLYRKQTDKDNTQALTDMIALCAQDIYQKGAVKSYKKLYEIMQIELDRR